MSQLGSREEAMHKVGELVRQARIAMLITRSDEGALHGRPMAAIERDFDGHLWFFTGRSSPKVAEIEAEPGVNVSISDPKNQNYVSLAGRAHLVLDRNLFTEFWHPAFEAWFEDGLEDPDLALIRVDVETAQYWDSPSSPVAHLSGFLKTKFGGQPEVGDNGTLDLRGQ